MNKCKERCITGVVRADAIGNGRQGYLRFYRVSRDGSLRGSVRIHATPMLRNMVPAAITAEVINHNLGEHGKASATVVLTVDSLRQMHDYRTEAGK